MKSNIPDKQPLDDHDYSIKHFVKEALHDLTHFDTKLIKTLKPLLFKPGYLTRKAFSAEQSEYVKPLALFVFLNFIFFIFKVKGLFNYNLEGYQSEKFYKNIVTGAFNKTGLSPALFAERFNTAMKFEEKEYLIIMVPLLAALVQLLYIFQKKHYIQHLIFSLHFYSFFLVFLTLSPLLFYIIVFLLQLVHIKTAFLFSESATLGIVLPVWFVYLLFSMRLVYRQNWLLTIFKAAVATGGVLALIIFVYRLALFFIVLHSVSD